MRNWEIAHVIFTFGLLYFAAGTNIYDNKENNIRCGIMGAFVVLLLESMLQTKEGPFQMKCQSILRISQRFVIIYLLLLVFLAFQNEKDARQLFTLIYPSLGKPVPKDMHTYDENCEFKLENITDNLDHYFVIHLVNWFFATLILRDYYLLHFWSILDEIIELSFQHILPHFRECWWDHVILDFLMSNTVSIIIGMTFIRVMGWEQYDWLGRKGQGLFSWKIWSCHKRLGMVTYMMTIIILNFLTGFFLINSLWIPPYNWINIYRLVVWFTLGMLAFQENYNDISTWNTENRKNTYITGHSRWLATTVVGLEIFCSLKFLRDAGNLQDVPTPLYKSVPWISVYGFLALLYLYNRFKQNATTQFPSIKAPSSPSNKPTEQKSDQVESKENKNQATKVDQKQKD